MSWLPFERRWADALLEAMIPSVGTGLPPMSEVDLQSFWDRFEAVAPLHLRLGMRVATWPLAGGLPLAMGLGATLPQLDDAAREAVLLRAASLAPLAMLLEVVKIVGCFAYFDDPAVQDAVRRGVRS